MMLSFLMPKEIHILPFTKFASFDQDRIPDGIRVYLKPVNYFDDPINIAGIVHFELYAYQPASGDPKGVRLQFWETKLVTESEQRRYWNRATQMYEFDLAVDVATIPRHPKIVLLVTYNTPWAQHLEDQMIIDLEFERSRLQNIPAAQAPDAAPQPGAPAVSSSP